MAAAASYSRSAERSAPSMAITTNGMRDEDVGEHHPRGREREREAGQRRAAARRSRPVRPNAVRRAIAGDHRRQHQRHGHQRTQPATAGEVDPGQQPGQRQPEHEADEHRRGRGGRGRATAPRAAARSGAGRGGPPSSSPPPWPPGGRRGAGCARSAGTIRTTGGRPSGSLMAGSRQGEPRFGQGGPALLGGDQVDPVLGQVGVVALLERGGEVRRQLPPRAPGSRRSRTSSPAATASGA